MCGIAGFIRTDRRPVEQAELKKMIATLNHRGPDASGTQVLDSVGLAHSRLSIVDLAGGLQPMQTPDGMLSVTFNGEIFNHIELRAELQQKGYQFQTHSDTEVILLMYAEYGPECVHHFNGQWAFAIHDRRKQEVFLSRDRMGIRPLVYTQTPSRFCFASEIKALFALPDVERRVDHTALNQLFTFWSPLPPRTFFAGVSELPPGHSMIVKDGNVKIWQYWNLDYSPNEDNRSLDDWADELRSLLINATQLRLRADVSVGAYLSGGLDSSITAAIIRNYTNAPLNTFSVNFNDKDFDESQFQQEMITELGTDHQTVCCSYDDIGRIFPTVIQHTEKPVLRTAPAPMFLLSKLVRESQFKVVMTGEGADEVFGGYDLFKETKIRRFWSRQPDSKIRPLLLKRLYPYMKNLQAQSPDYLKAFFKIREDELDSPFFSHLPRWDLTAKLKTFFSDDLKQELQAQDPQAEFQQQLPAQFSEWPSFCQAQYLEAINLMPGYILSSQGDRMAMGNSVEGRFPFLDYRVVEFASRVPVRFKMNGLNEKFLLKYALRDLIPDSIRQRPKQPYRSPDAHSFIDSNSQRARFAYVNELLSPECLEAHGLFQPTAVQRLVKKMEQGRAIGTRDNMALVGILSTQILVEQMINGQTVTAGKETTAPATITS
ncbi:asparagine synthase (glutamine-hydrolyzing) [Gimesia benthica]|uniref:asparagine synthase (glutamine-hydrolyzing) n=1 Tax=Gimesia benthica TaxID=2608982 RepID=A0A6I6AF32_9PLAN|nr:asparagine synthase (glutamine-hydrolyzing) [Gimesia benthica]QGQ25083.1 asparagine synthase (glutamine-hydrolyzing) [Gimesia benthica]